LLFFYFKATERLQLREKDWQIEYLSSKMVRETKSNWDHPKFLVDWLLEADIHVILCQGIHLGFLGIWVPEQCKNEILRLEFHPGFPARTHLRCPVFNGDKFGYLSAAQSFTNPSFKLELKDNAKSRKATIQLAKE
jgi:hypothetical protein